jgi:hypothetical protein
MSEPEFENADDPQVWLIGKGVPQSMAPLAAPTLFANEFFCPDSLYGISADMLTIVGLKPAVAQTLSNMLVVRQQQQDGEFKLR